MVIVLTLLIPLLGVGLLLIDASRQRELPFQSRSFWALLLRVLGGVSIVAGVALVLACGVSILQEWATRQEDALGQWLTVFPLALALGVVVILTGWQTFRLKRTWPSDDEDWDDEAVIDRYSPLSLMAEPRVGHLRSGAWAMTLFPLVYVLPILGTFGILLLIIGTIVLSAVVRNRRSFQCQLLWLLAITIRNRLPLGEELRSLSINKGVKLKRRLQQAAKDIEQGDPLWMVLERHGLLPSASVAAIRVSEGGGRLDETLRRLAAQATDRLKVFNVAQIGEVLLQLFVLLTVGSTIVVGVMYYIIPKFKQIFVGFDVKLPRSTQLLIDLSDHVVGVSAVILFWVGLGMLCLIWQALRNLVGWSSLPFPVLMHWFPKRDAPEVLRALAGIAREGASIPARLLWLVERPGRPDLGARYQRIADRMNAGDPLSISLEQEGVVTPLQREAVAAGERGGHLEFVLFSLAETLDQREFRNGAYWAELLKPVAIISCAIATAFVAISMFMPLVKLLNELS